ncbi:universal stress protein [Fluviicola taffensis]|uniref:UspA domain-containing protein n=1 Tax=Fluviicola taffensis (strain DSM 16823 / NCIMB 13979 / RW262) TaxID=755732 RepID=F2IEF2_FLUTR|nr:universal stress protein [Fluviicola taffensis]AEA43476.1 UspA domain-containing protein [Fluviicola taffensis DSM 16823]
MAIKFHYLVPIDFTPVTENALVFALDAAKYNKGEIILLHIISHAKERIVAERNMNDLAKKYENSEVTISTRVVIGKVLRDIGIIADSLGVQLIIMGTHNTSIWQKIFGSPALSVVSNSNVPIVLTQQDTSFHKIKTIVMTVDLSRESVQVVKYASRVAKTFNSKMYLVGQKYSDEGLMQKIEVNLKVANGYLKDHGLEANIHLLENTNFEKNLIGYCKEIKADLLAATCYQDGFSLFSTNLVQSLSENELSIPVMTLDGEDTSTGSQFGFITQ